MVESDSVALATAFWRGGQSDPDEDKAGIATRISSEVQVSCVVAALATLFFPLLPPQSHRCS